MGDETVPSRQRSDEYVRRAPSASPVHVWLLGFIVALLALAVCGLWALYLKRGQFASGGPTPTAIVWTPTPAPSPTLAPTKPVMSGAEGMVEPAPTILPKIAIGHYVRVAGTEGHGLNLRSGPGTNYTRMDVALEGEVFIVVDGPAVSGGSEWWKVRDPESAEREWWAVGNFLETVDHP